MKSENYSSIKISDHCDQQHLFVFDLPIIFDSSHKSIHCFGGKTLFSSKFFIFITIVIALILKGKF